MCSWLVYSPEWCVAQTQTPRAQTCPLNRAPTTAVQGSLYLSLVSPTCFHSFRVGPDCEFGRESSVEPDDETPRVFLVTCSLAAHVLGLAAGVPSFACSSLSASGFGGRIKDFNLKIKNKTDQTTKPHRILEELAEHNDTEMPAERHIHSPFP